jgi:hypothetical protein
MLLLAYKAPFPFVQSGITPAMSTAAFDDAQCGMIAEHSPVFQSEL